jgi:hypothetical protein
MTQLILWMIITYGLSNIVVYGSIFNGPRNTIKKWGENEKYPFSDFGKFLTNMMACMMCFGFHCGWFLSISIYSPVHEILGVSSWSSWFFDGFLASGAAWIINSIVEWFEENRPTK